MSIAMEWLAMVLVGFAGTPEPKADGPEITYQFQVIEVHGLQWREAADRGLKPVASRGGVTVWTAPRDFFKTFPQGTTKEVRATPRVTAFSQAPAHFTIRNNHPFVTQVAWRGEDVAPRQTTDTVREGLTSTIVGRCIDQGVLAQLVIEDTDIRSVHTLNVPAPTTASVSSGKTIRRLQVETGAKIDIVPNVNWLYQNSTFLAYPSAYTTNIQMSLTQPLMGSAPLPGQAAGRPVGLEANRAPVEDLCLVTVDVNGPGTLTAEEAVIEMDKPLSFKNVFDHCIEFANIATSCETTCPAAAQAKAADAAAKQAGLDVVIKDSCCADDGANAAECHGSQAASCPAEKVTCSPSRLAQVQIPEIGHAEIAGEWLIPRDEVLLVGFGPHTVADKDGKAVVRERLVLITAEELAGPTASTGAETPELPRSLPRMAVSPPRLAIPAPPTRTLPQGVHADGTPAELPPLPDDEKAVPSPSPGDSSEPRPSPQTKKPSRTTAPAPNPTLKPTAFLDAGTTRTAFELAKGLFKANPLPQFAFPNLQFMMPLKPFAMKLPFNQKLELELIGRVVPDSEAASDAPQADE